MCNWTAIVKRKKILLIVTVCLIGAKFMQLIPRGTANTLLRQNHVFIIARRGVCKVCGLVSSLLVRLVYIKIPISNVSAEGIFTRKLNQLIIVSCTSLLKPASPCYWLLHIVT